MNTSQAEISLNLAGHKRTRQGETFIDPSEVTLHCHDFTFDAIKRATICADAVIRAPLSKSQPLAQRRGFHVAPSSASNGANSAAPEAGLKVGGTKEEDADGYVYYGAVAWGTVSNGADEGRATLIAEDVFSFAKLHDLYTNECGRLLKLAVVGKEDDAYNSVSVSTAATEPTTATSAAASTTEVVSPWEKHYELTTNNFFPIKNYIHRAFPTMLAPSTNEEGKEETSGLEARSSPTPRLIMECGCGNGSAVLTFLRNSPQDSYICFDISATAVRLLKEHSITRAFLEKRSSITATSSVTPPLTAFVYDICDPTNELDEAFLTKMAQHGEGRGAALPYRKGTVDQLLLIFVLCALPSVSAMRVALKRMAYWLKPGRFVSDAEGKRQWEGGRLLFRDYAILDHNMLRFLERPSTVTSSSAAEASSGQLQYSPFFEKGDGTSQFFFEKAFTCDLFASCGLTAIDVSYHCNEVKNRKNGKVMRKVFINAEFGVL